MTLPTCHLPQWWDPATLKCEHPDHDDCTCEPSERDSFGNVDRIPNPSCPVHEN